MSIRRIGMTSKMRMRMRISFEVVGSELTGLLFALWICISIRALFSRVFTVAGLFGRNYNALLFYSCKRFKIVKESSLQGKDYT